MCFLAWWWTTTATILSLACCWTALQTNVCQSWIRLSKISSRSARTRKEPTQFKNLFHLWILTRRLSISKLTWKATWRSCLRTHKGHTSSKTRSNAFCQSKGSLSLMKSTKTLWKFRQRTIPFVSWKFCFRKSKMRKRRINLFRNSRNTHCR